LDVVGVVLVAVLLGVGVTDLARSLHTQQTTTTVAAVRESLALDFVEHLVELLLDVTHELLVFLTPAEEFY
jgi:hypothetical protein